MRQTGATLTAGRLPARHVRGHGPWLVAAPDVEASRPQPAPPPPAPPVPGYSPAPPTLRLVISRRARREAVAAAEAESRRDPRVDAAERVLAGVQLVGNLLVLGLSAVGWLWLGAHRPARAAGGTPGSTGAVSGGAATGLGGHPLVQPLSAASGTTLVLIMLAACLLLAPVVNPFYAPPSGRRLLHASTTVLFGVLAVTTVAVIAGAAR